jgi:hypothetical protein
MVLGDQLPEAAMSDVTPATLCVWWLDQSDFAALIPWWELPEYIKREVQSAYGRPARCRLWVAACFGDVQIHPWPTTPIANRCEGCAGIVLRRSDLEHLRDLPGIVTDLELRRLIASPAAAKGPEA